VAMDDPFLVSMLHRVTHVDEESQAVFDGEVVNVTELCDLAAMHEFHDEVGPACRRRARIEHLRDARMLSQCERLPFRFAPRNLLRRGAPGVCNDRSARRTRPRLAPAPAKPAPPPPHLAESFP